MKKLDNLKNIISKYDKLCIAYSGGTDSDFLLNVANEVLGANVIAIIANGAMLSEKDFNDAIMLSEKIGVKYYVIDLDVFTVPQFVNNDKERCYYCKKNVMGGIIKKAEELGFRYIADGKNADDGKVYRPGGVASKEMGIISPLFEAEFSKSEIRQCSKELGISTWDKPSNSCLATRFPYDTVLTPENLKCVEIGEKLISDVGIISGRIRVHGDIARIEMPKIYFDEFIKNKKLIDEIKDIGFKYITLDLEGFRSGSMD